MILAASLLTTAACGAGDDSAKGDTGSAGLGPQLTVTFDLTGAISLSGKQNAAVPTDNGTFASSCADYALAAPGSEPSIAVDSKIYGTWPDSTSSKAVTDGKGGGVWTFKKLAVTGPEGTPGAAVSGTVKWACRE
jgi:hypothetical protein